MPCSKPVDTATKAEFFERAGGKCVGLTLVDGHLGHFQASTFRQSAHRIDNPGFVCVLRLRDDLGAGGPLGHRFADQQRDERAAKAHDHGKAQQCAQVQAIGRQKAVDAQQRGHHAQHQHHSQVGDDQ